MAKQTQEDDSSGGGDDDDSLGARWAPSPERHAGRLGLTVAEVRAQKEAHYQASRDLQSYIRTLPKHEGKQKHQLVCQFKYNNGKYPFVCKQCWTYQPICLCGEIETKLDLPERVERICLWTHHREWGSISNTGSLLPIILKNTKLFMKGLAEHDEEMEAIISTRNSANSDHKVVVLWPDNDSRQDKAPDENRISWQELLESTASNDSMTLLVLEGTWRTARRMAAKLPPEVIKVALPHEQFFWKSHREEKSVLNPMRRQRGEEFSKDNVCTAEATAAALVSLGMDLEDGQKILDLVATKVERTRRYQGRPITFRD